MYIILIRLQLQLISPNEHLTSVDNVQQFVVVVQKFVSIIFCSVISQQHASSGDLRHKVFVIAILYIVINLCTIGVSENKS